MGVMLWIVFFSLYSIMLYMLYRIRSSRKGYGRTDRGDDDHGGGGEPWPDKDPVLDLPPGIGLASDIDERILHSNFYHGQASSVSSS